MSLLLIVPESYFQNVIVIFWLFTWGKYWNSSLSSPFVQRCCEPKQWAVGLGGRLWLCSPWRGGWEVRGAPLTSSEPHRPDRHLKSQCKHKGISQNEFVSKPHLVVTMVPEHECARRAGAARGGAVCDRGWSSRKPVRSQNGAPRFLCADVRRGCPRLAVVTWCAGFFGTCFKV